MSKMKATPHINPQGPIAKTILLPGDPLRAKFIAETYLEDAQQFNSVRNMLGFTGYYQGTQVSVMGSGMGIPSISLYAWELIHVYGCEKLIRIGTCGSRLSLRNRGRAHRKARGDAESEQKQRILTGVEDAPRQKKSVNRLRQRRACKDGKNKRRGFIVDVAAFPCTDRALTCDTDSERASDSGEPHHDTCTKHSQIHNNSYYCYNAASLNGSYLYPDHDIPRWLENSSVFNRTP